MRVLVGTLASGERELDQCVASIARQRGVEVEQFVIEGLGKKAAHDALFARFAEASASVDMLTKVDADMVLAHDDVLAAAAGELRARPNVDMVSIAVHDFFTDRLVDGMHSFRPAVDPARPGDRVFTDYVGIPESRRWRDFTRHAPAAEHAPDPSPLQAFHFGVHKGVKVRAAAAAGFDAAYRFHFENLEIPWRRFLASGDRRLGLAALGGEMALGGTFEIEDCDYGSVRLHEALERAEALDDTRLAGEIRRCRRTTGGFLPERVRRWAWRRWLR